MMNVNPRDLRGVLCTGQPGRTYAFSRIGRPGGNLPNSVRLSVQTVSEEGLMNGLIYLIGLIVVIMAILSFFGLR